MATFDFDPWLCQERAPRDVTGPARRSSALDDGVLPPPSEPIRVKVRCWDPERQQMIEARLRELGRFLPVGLPDDCHVTHCAVHSAAELRLLLGPSIVVLPGTVLLDLTGLIEPWIAAVLGLAGYLRRECSPEQQAYCLQQVARGYSCALPPDDGEYYRSRERGRLTFEQRRILALIARGFPHDDICEALRIPPGTFRHRLDAIRELLRLKPGTNLAIAAIRCGFHGPEVQPAARC